MKTKLLLTTIFTLISFVAMTAVADTKVYPGAMGQTVGLGNPTPYFSPHGGIYNSSSTKNLDLVLPLVHDAGKSRPASGWVNVVDQSANKAVRAKLRSRSLRPSGDCTWWGYTSAPKSTSPGASPCEKTLNFPTLGKFASSWHYFFLVTVPPQKAKWSGIPSYGMREDGNE